MRFTTSLLLVLALLALLTSACASVPMSTGPGLLSQAPKSEPTPSASGFPRGRFSAVSTPNMLLLTIENDGSFRLYLDDRSLDSGTFYVTGAQVLVESITCARHGAQAARPAAYAWSYDEEDVLAFEPVISDPCPERREYLAEQYQPKYLFIFNVPDRGVSKDWLW